MATKADIRRRWLGAMCLVVALLMLAFGERILGEHPRKAAFLGYWLGCLVFTLLAIVTAFLDLHALRRDVRDQQRELLESTLGEIAQQKQTQSTKPRDNR